MNQTLKKLLVDQVSGLSEEVQSAILRFYDLVLQENEAQNLTRLTSPEDFFYGHFQDVFQLIQLGWVGFPALDLGSGVGIPGIGAALIQPGKWVLCDSEKKKAEYLARAVVALGLEERASVVSGRAEEYLKRNPVDSIVFRAVGTLERVYSWIRPCSTWNNLILFKGPGWPEEWASFQKTKYRKELQIVSTHEYSVGPQGDEKARVLIQLKRVPRGT